MFAIPNTSATWSPPPVICATCQHPSGRNNFSWTVEKGGFEICSHCRQELVIKEDAK